MHIKTSLYVPPKSRSFITSVSFYDILALWIFILECRPMVTWYILPRIWLCSLFVHLDPEKHFNSFLLLYWFLLCMEMALEDLHIPKLLTEIHIRMHVCTKSFSSAHFPTFTLHQTKAWKLSTFYAYIECTSMHRIEICAEKLFCIRTKDSIFLRQHNIRWRNIEIGLCKLLLRCVRIAFSSCQKMCDYHNY